MQYIEQIRKIYTQVQFSDTDDDDVAVDVAGYTGNFHRASIDQSKLQILSISDLARIIVVDNKLHEIMKRISEIDREHNGYVTSTELDDIIQLSYFKELAGKSLKSIFKPYSSI